MKGAAAFRKIGTSSGTQTFNINRVGHHSPIANKKGRTTAARQHAPAHGGQSEDDAKSRPQRTSQRPDRGRQDGGFSPRRSREPRGAPDGSPGTRELLFQQLAAARQDFAHRTQLALERMELACVDSLQVVEASSAQLRRENERLSAENARLHAQLTEHGLAHGGHMGGTGESGGLPLMVAQVPLKTTLAPEPPGGPPTMNLPGAVHEDLDNASKIEAGFERAGNYKPNHEQQHMDKDRSYDASGFGDESEDDGRSKTRRRRSVFADADKMKQKVREAVMQKQYDVKDAYKDAGIFPTIAKSQLFENITLVVILVNAIWIMVDLDFNPQKFILDAHPVFQVAEFSFCAYFLLEIIIRFLAFRRKLDCLRDAWFVFDFTLVLTMLFDTGFITIFIAAKGGSSYGSSPGAFADPTILKMFRILKITRVSRMLRLLRATPELMILIKGIVVAFRSVLFTLALLMIFIYLFAIIFKSLTEDSPSLREDLFPDVLSGMLNLLLQGTLPDHEGLVMRLWNESAVYGLLAIFFILMTSLTVMNMLVGVLVEVVGVVSTVEKEQMNVQFVYAKLQELLEEGGLDADGDMRISKAEFESLILNPKAARMVQEVGVDVVGLVDFSEYLFQNDATLSFPEFMDLVLQLRGSNTATVKDVVDLRKFISSQVLEINDTIRDSKGLPRTSRRTRGYTSIKSNQGGLLELGARDAIKRPPMMALADPTVAHQWAAPRPPSSGPPGGSALAPFDMPWSPSGDEQSISQLLDEEV